MNWGVTYLLNTYALNLATKRRPEAKLNNVAAHEPPRPAHAVAVSKEQMSAHKNHPGERRTRRKRIKKRNKKKRRKTREKRRKKNGEKEDDEHNEERQCSGRLCELQTLRDPTPRTPKRRFPKNYPWTHQQIRCKIHASTPGTRQPVRRKS